MANILLQNQNPQPNPTIDTIRRQGPSNILFANLYQNNPSFRQFADSMRGKTPEQAFSENGLDFNQFRQYKW